MLNISHLLYLGIPFGKDLDDFPVDGELPAAGLQHLHVLPPVVAEVGRVMSEAFGIIITILISIMVKKFCKKILWHI